MKHILLLLFIPLFFFSSIFSMITNEEMEVEDTNHIILQLINNYYLKKNLPRATSEYTYQNSQEWFENALHNRYRDYKNNSYIIGRAKDDQKIQFITKLMVDKEIFEFLGATPNSIIKIDALGNSTIVWQDTYFSLYTFAVSPDLSRFLIVGNRKHQHEGLVYDRLGRGLMYDRFGTIGKKYDHSFYIKKEWIKLADLKPGQAFFAISNDGAKLAFTKYFIDYKKCTRHLKIIINKSNGGDTLKKIILSSDGQELKEFNNITKLKVKNVLFNTDGTQLGITIAIHSEKGYGQPNPVVYRDFYFLC